MEAGMSKRTPFPRVFWIANTIEVLERFAYYGIYFGFGIYMASLGFNRAQLGVVQSIFLFISYGIPVISGSFADRYLAQAEVALDAIQQFLVLQQRQPKAVEEG